MNEFEKRMHRVCFTGHRPERLHMREEVVKSALLSEIIKAIYDGKNVFISGMARGVDLWAAEIIVGLREEYPELKLICASPYEGFEKCWSKEWKKLYTEILKKADLVRFICPQYSGFSYQRRNEWMVNHSSRVIAVWNGEKSGTQNTIRYAEKCGVCVINVYE